MATVKQSPTFSISLHPSLRTQKCVEFLDTASLMKSTATMVRGGVILCSQCSTSSGIISSPKNRAFCATSVILTSFVSVNSDAQVSVLRKRNRSQRLGLIVPFAAESTQPTPSPSVLQTTADNKSIVPDDQFSITKVSFGVIGLGVGLSLLSYGFGGYFNILPGSEWSALMLTYGFPLAIIGMALKYAELKPVPCVTYSDAQALREKCATPILQQVRSDVTRYRYGDEQHLDEALKRIFQYGQGGGIPRRSAPVLTMIREQVTEDGRYCLVLVFEAKALQLSDFVQRQAKFASFFGPGISAEIAEGGNNNLYEVRLISNTTPS